MVINTDSLAKAIVKANVGKTSYIAKVVCGEHIGKYVTMHRTLVKSRSAALSMVTRDLAKWAQVLPCEVSIEDVEVMRKYRHEYEIEVSDGYIVINANNRNQAAKKARDAGYDVHSVNKTG